MLEVHEPTYATGVTVRVLFDQGWRQERFQFVPRGSGGMCYLNY